MERFLIVAVLATLIMNATVPAFALEESSVDVKLKVRPELKVGTPSKLEILVSTSATGEPITNVRIEVDISIAEEDMKLFSGDFFSPDGKLVMTYHFQDASEHSINVRVFPTEKSNLRFNPVSKIFTVSVIPPDPPTNVWVKTWAFLIGVLILGVGIGYYSVKPRSNV